MNINNGAKTVLNLFYRIYVPIFEGQGYTCEAITAITNFVNYIDQETVKVIRTNKCNQRSINLAERLKFKRDKAIGRHYQSRRYCVL